MFIFDIITKYNNFITFITPSVSQYLSLLEDNFVLHYLSFSSFNATLIIG